MKKDVLKDPIYISILRILRKEGKIRPIELARIFNVSRQAIDYRMKVLQNTGYVDKEYINGKVYYKLSEYAYNSVNYIRQDIDTLPINSEEFSEKFLDKLGFIPIKRHSSWIFILFLWIGIMGLLYFYIVYRDTTRGIISFIIWIIIGIIVNYFKEKILNSGNMK